MAPDSVGNKELACCDAHTSELYGFDFIIGKSIRLTGSERSGVYDIAICHNTGVTLFVICPSCMPQRAFHFDLENYKKFLEGQNALVQTISKQDFDDARQVEYGDGPEPFPYDREKDARRIITPLIEQLAKGREASKVAVSLDHMYVDARPLTYYSILDKKVVDTLEKEFTARYKRAH
jgi:hypothetical protein